MSRPRQTRPLEAVGLVLLGLGTTLSMSPLLLRDYTGPKCKNIAQKNGDWHVPWFVLLASYGLCRLAFSQR